MKERDEVKMAVRHYRFVLLRIRFPDGLILQGTEYVSSFTFSKLYTFEITCRSNAEFNPQLVGH